MHNIGSLLRFLLLASTSDIRIESLLDSRSQTGRKSVKIFPVSAYQEKARIINHNNDNNDNPGRKREGLPVVVWPPAHAVTIQKEDLDE